MRTVCGSISGRSNLSGYIADRLADARRMQMAPRVHSSDGFSMDGGRTILSGKSNNGRWCRRQRSLVRRRKHFRELSGGRANRCFLLPYLLRTLRAVLFRAPRAAQHNASRALASLLPRVAAALCRRRLNVNFAPLPLELRFSVSPASSPSALSPSAYCCLLITAAQRHHIMPRRPLLRTCLALGRRRTAIP